jgi:dipeptidyl aminopeptidase/acylaminoacyl peptidase
MRHVIFFLIFATLLPAQKLPLTPKDYGQFESLAPNGALSPDGKWLAYGVNRSNRESELRISKLADGSVKTAAFGTMAAFSADSRWCAYAIGLSEAQEEKLQKDKKPVQRKLGLMNLGTGEQTTLDAIESFAFSPNGAYLAMRRYAPEKKDADEESRGATLIVRDLASGRDTTLGNVSEYVWQDLPKTGRLLAIAISEENKTGNGVQVYDPESGTLRVLDSSANVYSGLTWRKKSDDLAALRSKSNDAKDGPTQTALAWIHANLPAHAYDPTSTDTRIVAARHPQWSEDGSTIFLGLAKWPAKPNEAKKDAEEPAAVDVWHWRDADVMPKQKKSAKTDAQKSMLAAWHLSDGSLTPLAHSLTEQVTPLKQGNIALVKDWTAYAMNRSIGRPAADVSLIDLASGARTKIRDGLQDDEYLQPSPGGKYLLFFQDDHYWTINTATRTIVNITKNAKGTFVNRESDATVKQKPPFGVAGWTKDDATVILYDKFDLWEIAPDGSRATRLTDGAADQIRHRYVRLDPTEEFIDRSKPLYLSLFGVWSKKSGYARLDTKEEHLLCVDKSILRLSKAKDADVYAYVQETFEESPNYFVAGADLHDARRASETNPFQSKYAWGRNELIEYKNERGDRLQGTLYYPAGYEAGKRYPMIVYMYEKLSDGLHRYSAPSEREYYNPGAITSHGYFLLMPDIVFRPREPGLSVADCVSAAVKKVAGMGVIDPAKVGAIGHSWGGFDTVFLATHTNVFAAAVAGAPITDLVSNYGNHHWSSGIAETDHIETGQQRMEVPLYEDLQAYIRNSAVFNVQNMKTPLMIEVGDADGTVFFHQGVELYNIARRAGKEVVLLVYAGEDHGIRKKADQIDYQRRIFAWFDHYLKGQAAAEWITEGEPYLKRQQELKTSKAKDAK